MINALPFALASTGDVSAGLLLLAFAILLIAILIDDDDLPGPRLYRVPAKS